MATPDIQKEYTGFLTNRIAIELANNEHQNGRELGNAMCLVKDIAICEYLNEVSSEEAELLRSSIFNLYPQLLG
ncbi:MAG: hypothetical protein NTV24_02585 [Candidatus Woesebacteria bacterium]|nr:hypothetical protein [Candidatus Woesebacteria bacterium]